MGKRKSEDTYYAKTLDKRVKSANKKAAKGCGNIHTMLYGVRASSAAAREDGPSQPVEASPSVEKDIPPVEKEMTSAEKADTSRSDTGRNNWCTIRKLCFKGIVAPFLHSAVVHVQSSCAAHQ